LTQQSYLEKLSGEYFSIFSAPNKKKDKILDPVGQGKYRKAVGSLGRVAQVSRPDPAFQQMISSTKSGCASEEDGRKLARSINKLQDTKYNLAILEI